MGGASRFARLPCLVLLVGLQARSRAMQSFCSLVPTLTRAPPHCAAQVCLDELSTVYDSLTTELESVAYPALDALAAKVGAVLIWVSLALGTLHSLRACRWCHLIPLLTVAWPLTHSLTRIRTQVTSPNLEKVRRIKNRLVRLTTRVETVREVLEKVRVGWRGGRGWGGARRVGCCAGY